MTGYTTMRLKVFKLAKQYLIERHEQNMGSFPTVDEIFKLAEQIQKFVV